MKSRKPSIPYIIWMAVFTMIPMIMVGITAFTGKNGGFSLEAFEKAFFYKEVFLRSLWIALISTAICLLIAYPLAYMLTKMKPSTQNFVNMLLMIPMWMNFCLEYTHGLRFYSQTVRSIQFYHSSEYTVHTSEIRVRLCSVWFMSIFRL